VPFSYGGGDATGPTRGSGPAQNAIGLDRSGRVVGLDPAASVVGFDASGLILYSFAGVGIKMPRSSGEQYKVGRKVAPAQALPGDLLFYGPEGTQSVAMFLGNGQMIEATDPVVTVSPVRTNGMTPYLVRIIN
jgi:cell wall-associated NlpC family hydrolase